MRILGFGTSSYIGSHAAHRLVLDHEAVVGPPR
jgi:UDP-glucose 4-epimerase